jgi:RimJ/RimL family protein N-acetyltransferase
MDARRDADPSPVRLRLLSPAGARRIGDREPASDELWAPDYPTDGDREAAIALLRDVEHGKSPGAFGPYEVIEAVTGIVVGGIGFHAAPGADGAVEVGYGIVASATGRGYATAALVALLAVARSEGVQVVRGRALPDNTASRRVMEKAGLAFCGITDGYACYEHFVDASPAMGDWPES